MGHILIKRFGSLQSVLAAPYNDIASLETLPHSIIECIQLTYAIGQRMARANIEDEPIDRGSAPFRNYLFAAMAHEHREQLRLFSLDAERYIIDETVSATGTINHLHVYPREIMGVALFHNARAIILAHNHPSGDAAPSDAERAMVVKIGRGADVFAIELEDYVMVGNAVCFSFREHGLLPARAA